MNPTMILHKAAHADSIENARPMTGVDARQRPWPGSFSVSAFENPGGAARLNHDRPRDSGTPLRIALSVMCHRHHFVMIRARSYRPQRGAP